MPDSLRQILADTGEFLRFQAEMGLDELEATPELQKFLAEPAATPPATAVEQPAAKLARPLRKPPAPRPKPPEIPTSGQPIGEIHQELAGCRLCPLHENRRQVVAGSGTGRSGLLVIEEAPGEGEESGGGPLAGEAGELFDRMLKAIGLEREQVYLTSLVKCRPPADREPAEAEIHACLNHLFRQIAAVRPTVICGLGPLAARVLTAKRQSLFQLRGRFHDFHGTPLMLTFHPRFLLLNPEMKKASWQDLQLIQKKLSTLAR